jgi:uncharacterized protein YndB with AHSA1/START domain
MTDMQRMLDALTSPIRREILWRIWDTELAAGVISTGFDAAASTISEHLAVLRDAGLVSVRAEGTFRYYAARQDALRQLPHMLLMPESRWIPTAGLDDVPGVTVGSGIAVTVAVALASTRDDVFDAFVDGRRFGRWLGVPVTIDDGRFSATMEWGTEIRGRYEVVAPPELIVMVWDFADDQVPVPGGETTAYVRFREVSGGCRVVVDQLVSGSNEATFMEAAWRVVLTRLQDGIANA